MMGGSTSRPVSHFIGQVRAVNLRTVEAMRHKNDKTVCSMLDRGNANGYPRVWEHRSYQVAIQKLLTAPIIAENCGCYIPQFAIRNRYSVLFLVSNQEKRYPSVRIDKAGRYLLVKTHTPFQAGPGDCAA
jgi:hypothetical protein